ncbi:MAG TPA: DUF1698 domain-containing protein [Candidatus Acidoferrum sp.]|nr:DUF1698 domain-containing protein [Candidatus Acidoferrum sp.]
MIQNIRSALSSYFNPLRDQLLVSSPFMRWMRSSLRRARTSRQNFPESPSALRDSTVFNAWWYYNVELLPGITTKGIYPDDFPLLPRILMRNCNLAGMDCLDLGSMEGLMPVLMSRQGARKVLATDATFHCYEKMAAVKHYYKARFQFLQVGLMYDLHQKLGGRCGFDFINVSGLLYHVFSPMHVLAGVRPLLKRNGIMILSTNVINRTAFSMEFNNHGKLQTEPNTFWYLSIPLLDYLLRYFKLLPLDCLYHPYTSEDPARFAQGFDAGYLSVVCRATDDVPLATKDEWGGISARESWEWIALCNETMLSGQPVSRIEYKQKKALNLTASDTRSINLEDAVRQNGPAARAVSPQDSHLLQLADQA